MPRLRNIPQKTSFKERLKFYNYCLRIEPFLNYSCFYLCFVGDRFYSETFYIPGKCGFETSDLYRLFPEVVAQSNEPKMSAFLFNSREERIEALKKAKTIVEKKIKKAENRKLNKIKNP